MNFKFRKFKSLSKDQRHIRIFVAVHVILWLSLTVLVGKRMLMDEHLKVSPFGISIQAAGPGSPYSTITIVDMASIINFVDKAWHGQTTVNSGASVYSVRNHLKVTSEWAGRKLNYSLSFGYSPTMLWVLAPLVFIPPFFTFILFDLMGLLAAWWMTRPSRCRLGFGLLAFFSPLAQACFNLGQTAFLTGACLLFIAEKAREGKNVAGWRVPVIAGAALWALTAKPPLAVTAGFALLCLRQWRPLLVAGAMAVISTLAITPILGPNWVHDYLRLIGTHDQINAGSAFAWSHVPRQMANLRGILSVDFGLPDDVASHVSAISWLAALAVIAVMSIRSKLSDGFIWSLAILSYLLFCPHVTSTEELQLVLLIPLCVSVQNEMSRWELPLLLFIPLLPFASPAVGVFEGNRLVLFVANLFLALFIIRYARQKATDANGRLENEVSAVRV